MSEPATMREVEERSGILGQTAGAADPRQSRMMRYPGDLTPRAVAALLGHEDGGARVRAFLRVPDDGGPPVVHTPYRHWKLDAEQAARVMRRFGAERPMVAVLSSRERQIVDLYASGATVPQVAAQVGVGVESVRTYLRRARAKLAAAGRPAASRGDLRALTG